MLWQAKPLDGSPRLRLAFDSISIFKTDLPDGVVTSLIAPTDGLTDGTLFFDATSELTVAATETGRVYSVELKTIASADHTIWPMIAIEILR